MHQAATIAMDQPGPRARGEPPRRPAPLPAYQPLVLVLATVVAGIAADRIRIVDTSATAWWFAGAGGLAAWGAARWLGAGRWWCSASLALAIAAAAGCWHHAWWNLYPRASAIRLVDDGLQPCLVRAVARGLAEPIPAPAYDPMRPYQSGPRTRIAVELIAIRDGYTWRPTTGRAWLSVDGVIEQVLPGDCLEVGAQIGRIPPPNNPGEFDFARHARADRRLVRLIATSESAVVCYQHGSPWSATRWLAWARQQAGKQLDRYVSARQAPLAAALVLGHRRQVDDDVMAAFYETGTIHLLCISGLHVGMLAGALWLVLRCGWLKRRPAIVLVVVVTVGYAALIDARAPALRATLLVLAVAAAAWVGRRGMPLNLLAAAALGALVVNPADALRAGPQLSLLAAGVLGWLALRLSQRPAPDPLARVIDESRPTLVRYAMRAGGRARDTILATIGVWIVVAPLVATQFHLTSPAAIVLVPLLSLPVAGALLSAFLILITGPVLPPLAALLGAVCDVCLGVVSDLVTTAHTVPGSSWWVVGPPVWWTAAWYVGVITVASLWPWRQARWISLALLAGWCLVLPVYQAGPKPAELRCTFVSVGHGCAVLVRLPDGQTLLYDAGQLGNPEHGARLVAGVLWSQGVRRIDHLVISHADVDHYNAVPHLLQRFPVAAVYVSPQMRSRSDPPVQAFWNALQRQNVQPTVVWQGQPIAAGAACRLSLLHPPRQGVGGNENAQSLVLLVEHEERRILLTGDLEGEGMYRLLNQPRLHCDLLLAPHHGSLRGNAHELAEWCRPEWVVVSGSRPTAELWQKLQLQYSGVEARVLHTARHGCCDITLRGGQLQVHTFHPH